MKENLDYSNNEYLENLKILESLLEETDDNYLQFLIDLKENIQNQKNVSNKSQKIKDNILKRDYYKIIDFLMPNNSDKFLKYLNLTKEEWEALSSKDRIKKVNNLSKKILKANNLLKKNWHKLDLKEREKIIDQFFLNSKR